MQKFEHQIFAHPNVVIETDHEPLISVFKKPLHSAPKRLQRMLLYLQKYNFDIRYVKGKHNCIADWLSRDTYRTAHDADNEETLVFRMEIENVDVFHLTPIKNSTLERIAKASAVDSEAQLLQKTIKLGWPTNKAKCPESLIPFWKHRAELTVDGDLILKGQAAYIPKSLRREMLSLAHSSHYNFTATWKRARDCIFWPTIKSELREVCETCGTCLAHLPKQAKEPMLLTPTATYPFQIVYQDIFSLDNNQYLVTVDSYSDYFEVDNLGHTATTERVISATEKHFARYGAPVELHSDNASQFTSTAFIEFLQFWSVTPVTSSPYFPQGNGKAEAAVKVAKRLLKKCKLYRENYQYALLDLRNTIQADNSSRAQKFLSRQLRCKLPSLMDRNFIQNHQQLRINREKKTQQKRHFDKRTKKLRPLLTGEAVRVQPLRKTDHWVGGSCVDFFGPRSYLVRLNDGTIIRRNRKHLKLVNGGDQKAVQSDIAPSHSLLEDPNLDVSMQSQRNGDITMHDHMARDSARHGSTQVDSTMRSEASPSPRSSTNTTKKTTRTLTEGRKRKLRDIPLTQELRRSARIKRPRVFTGVAPKPQW